MGELAEELREQDRNLTLMVQADMTAYHKPGEPMQLGLPQRSVHMCPYSDTFP